MITHDIVFHGPRTFDVEIDGAIRHAFTFGARTQRFEVETIGLLSRDDIYGGELEPLFLRLKENTPEGLNIVYILNGGKSLNDGLDDWLLSQMDPYVLPQLNMSPTETAGIRLQTGGAEFESSMAFGLKAHEIPLSSRMALGGNITLVPALNSAALETVADIMTEAIVYLSDRDELRLTTGITQTILKTITLDGEDDMLLMDMDGGRLKKFDERQLNHLGSLGLRASLRSRKAEMRNSVLAEGSSELQLITSADVSETIYENIREVMRLESPVTEAALDVAAGGRDSYMTLTTILSEEVKTGREIVPKQQITGLHIGRGTQPYLRYYDPERISDLDMETVFWLGEPSETVVLSSIIQSSNTMHLTTTADLETAP